MKNQTTKRSSFSGKIGFVLSAAGASVGLGNIWRFPYLAAKYGGGIFLLIYIILALTFGYTMIMAETSLGRMTKKSPVGAFASFGNSRWSSLGGWINAIIPVLIVPYYSVIGGWVLKYLVEYVRGHAQPVAEDGYFSAFISDGFSTEICFVIFSVITLAIIYAGVRNGIERVSKFMMPILVVCHHCNLFCDKTRGFGWCEIFSCAKYQQLFMDDRCGSHGADVLFAVDRDGYSHYIWFLYEKRNFH